MSNFSRHAGLINTSTIPSSPGHAGIFSNFSRHAGTITNFFPPCEIIFLKGHKYQYCRGALMARPLSPRTCAPRASLKKMTSVNVLVPAFCFFDPNE
jgi:hypothetical protein